MQHTFARLVVFLVLACLAACNGNDSSTAGGIGNGGTGAAVGTMTVKLTDKPAGNLDHVWVTISQVCLDTSTIATPDDGSWLCYTLPTTVTVDLQVLDNGTLATLFDSLSVPAGTYNQMRLILSSETAPLTTSATKETLVYNDQVNYTDSSGQHVVPLHIPNAAQGISAKGAFTVAAGQANNDVTFYLDAGTDVVSTILDGNVVYTLKPRLRDLSLSHVGAISGQIDLASIAAAGATNVVVKAEAPNAAGTLQLISLATTIRPDGSFILYPLAIPLDQPGTTVDILIRGSNMATMIIQGVTVAAGTAPATATALSQHALAVSTSTQYQADVEPNELNPSGSWVEFFQTVPGANELPYEVALRQGDPFSGSFTTPISLPVAPLQVATFNNGQDLSFASVTPVEGSGAYQVYEYAPGFTRTAAASILSAPAAGVSEALIDFPANMVPTNASNTISGTISVTTNAYDSGYLVITRNGLIADTTDISSILASGAGSSAAYVTSSLAGGSAASPLDGAIYYAYIVVWNSANSVGTLNIEPASGSADLGQGGETGFDLTVN